MDCGTFFNQSSLSKLFGLTVASSNDLAAVARSLQTTPCPECHATLANVRVCYPNSAQPLDEPNFVALAQVAAYSIEGLVKKTDAH